MNRALMVKTIRDHRLLFGLAFAASVIFPALVIVALSSAPIELVSQWMTLPMVRDFIRLLLGADPGDLMSRTSLAAFAVVHPVLLAVVWGYLVVVCTGVLANEVDRGTADLLLSLPISRFGVYASVSVVVFGCGPFLAVGPWLGAWASEFYKSWSEPLALGRLLLTVVNSLAAYWAVAGLGLAASACVSRRGVAVGILFAWLVISFLLNFLGVLWEPAERLAFLSLLNYFQPLLIVRVGRIDFGDVGVLLAVAAVGWGFGAIVFGRRDIRTT